MSTDRAGFIQREGILRMFVVKAELCDAGGGGGLFSCNADVNQFSSRHTDTPANTPSGLSVCCFVYMLLHPDELWRLFTGELLL